MGTVLEGWRERRVRSWTQRVGVSETKHLGGGGTKVGRIDLFRVFRIHELGYQVFSFVLIFFISVFLSVLRLSCRVCSIQCKAGWHEWNQACYKVSTDQKSFTDASALCNQDAGKLASIRSPQENEFVHNLTGGKDVFIGLTDTEIEGTFVWSDGSTVVYTNWEDGEPNDEHGIGDCVILVANGKWNDTPCSMWYEYLCKFPNAQTSQQQGKQPQAYHPLIEWHLC